MDEKLATPGRLVWVEGSFGRPPRLAVILEGGGSVGDGERWIDVAYLAGCEDLTVSRCLSERRRFPDLALWEDVRQEAI